MDLNLIMDFDTNAGTYVVWNKVNNSEFTVTFDCRDAALTFMVQLIAEVKQC